MRFAFRVTHKRHSTAITATRERSRPRPFRESFAVSNHQLPVHGRNQNVGHGFTLPQGVSQASTSSKRRLQAANQPSIRYSPTPQRTLSKPHAAHSPLAKRRSAPSSSTSRTFSSIDAVAVAHAARTSTERDRIASTPRVNHFEQHFLGGRRAAAHCLLSAQFQAESAATRPRSRRFTRPRASHNTQHTKSHRFLEAHVEAQLIAFSPPSFERNRP